MANGITEADVKQIWLKWADGDSVRRIHQFDFPEYSRRAIAELLAGDMPESLRGDTRMLPYRHICLAVNGPCQAANGAIAAFVVLRLPKRIRTPEFHKSLRRFARAAEAEYQGVTASRWVVEGLDHDVAERFVVKRGFPAWQADADGNVARLMPADFSAQADADTSAAPKP